MKRKAEETFSANGSTKKRVAADAEVVQNFRPGLFDNEVQRGHTNLYSISKPYKYGVIHDLLKPELLRKVRAEVQEHLSFTPKETDIYKIHQSGDLANLDGLSDDHLKLLPSLLTLRDSLYSEVFRKYISAIAGSGPLSGRKTDMAINVYTPGCHLLCHDDVIGSRRVSYILYLPDPDYPWEAEWGGALRLYPTRSVAVKDGGSARVPESDFSVSIPPAFNQLSFFTVQPGESFHDVEEVYHRRAGDNGEDGGRARMAISGWFHIPQEGEDGYEEGLEEQLAEQSSLNQLQSKSSVLDLPQQQWTAYDDDDGETADDPAAGELTEAELDFLLRYMNPNYLTPDTVEQLAAMFTEDSSLRLANFLSQSFAGRLRPQLEELDTQPVSPEWLTARPTHKHRFLYRQPDTSASAPASSITPHEQLYTTFFPSPAFRKWLSLATGLSPTHANALARRFRRGADYTLATEHNDAEPHLELCLGVTPTTGWGEGDGDDAGEGDEDSGGEIPAEAPPARNGAAGTAPTESVGGYEMYMAADEDDGDEGGGHEAPDTNGGSSHTGAGKRRKADPAVYRGGGEEEDDGVLFTMPAGWNCLSVVLRDEGVLRFVKYVSAAAPGDRWDVCAEFRVRPEEHGDEDEDE